jgi:hypothetical protein
MPAACLLRVRRCDVICASRPLARRAGRRPTSKHPDCRSPIGAGLDRELASLSLPGTSDSADQPALSAGPTSKAVRISVALAAQSGTISTRGQSPAVARRPVLCRRGPGEPAGQHPGARAGAEARSRRARRGHRRVQPVPPADQRARRGIRSGGRASVNSSRERPQGPGERSRSFDGTPAVLLPELADVAVVARRPASIAGLDSAVSGGVVESAGMVIGR